jgi:predicted DNA-binding transcriptional regulator AlpA
LREHFNIEDQRVLTVDEWAELNGISRPTALRVLKAGDGPPTIQLSKRRIGVRVGDNRRWQESRVRGAS